MALTYLIDENLRGTLMLTLLRTATRYGLALDVVQVGDPDAPPRETSDPDLLLWAEAENRILVSHDRRTMPAHLAGHLAAGRNCPGVFQLRHGRLSDLAEHLVITSFASDPSEWRDRVSYIP
jgi:predicted nuclease of predicted toxin-antitoxin system